MATTEQFDRTKLDLLQEAEEVLGQLEDLPADFGDLRLLARALRVNTLLLMTLSSFGECRQEVPFASLRPVIRADGTRVWCCNHSTEHCA